MDNVVNGMKYTRLIIDDCRRGIRKHFLKEPEKITEQ